MRIAVLSGKGGAGKTFVAVSLAAAAKQACYIDCDVEEPNGNLFFKPEEERTRRVSVMIPKFDDEKCTGCGLCTDFCRFNALALVRGRVLLFKEICHSCGGCVLLCPEDAADYTQREIGEIREGTSGSVHVLTGMLDTGESSGVPLVQELISNIPSGETEVIDCPPGSACLVMESIKTADYCVLVSEPTTFGAHDLAMAVELVRLFRKPAGVILNKCLPEKNPAKEYCLQTGVNILAEISFDRETGKLLSDAKVAVNTSPYLKAQFLDILATIKKEMRP